MKFNDYQTEFNRNVYIHNDEILDSNGLEGASYRVNMIEKLTGIFELDGVTIGVKPMSLIQSDMYVIEFSCNVLVLAEDDVNAKWLRIRVPLDIDQERQLNIIKRMCEDIRIGNMDVEEEFAKFEFTPYYEETV